MACSSNVPRGFQRFGFENHFGAGGFSDLGQGVGLLMVQSSPGVNPKPRFSPILDSTGSAANSAAVAQ